MSIEQATLGQRLREARDSCRLSQEAVADAVGIPRTALVHIEAGRRSVSTLELARLAQHYRRDISFFFADPAPVPEEDALHALFRLDATFQNNPRVKEDIGSYMALFKLGVNLEGALEITRRAAPPLYHLPDPRNTTEALQQGESVAFAERQRLGLGNWPIPDMSDLLNNLGVWASGALLPEGVSGIFLHHPSLGMAILVHYDHLRTRKRFSYAHEYAHALLDRDKAISISRTAEQSNLCEIRANTFAAAFLMPRDGVLAFLESLDKGFPSRQTVHVTTPADFPVEALHRPAPRSQHINFQDAAELQRHFRVSHQAAVYRLKNLGILTQAECDALLAQDGEARDYLRVVYSDEDMTKKEPEKDRRTGPDKELISQLAGLCVRAYRQSKISSDKLHDISEQLGFKGRDLLGLAKAAAEH
jgi:Zn-dependent peptidase ImmA (M78 family)/transcriptional regulator with XRE-family HTH domain